MRYIDKLRKEHPEFIDDIYPGGVAICPSDAGYEDYSMCDLAQPEADRCRLCWEREEGET